jgi:hypothetical protein
MLSYKHKKKLEHKHIHIYLPIVLTYCTYLLLTILYLFDSQFTHPPDPCCRVDSGWDALREHHAHHRCRACDAKVL